MARRSMRALQVVGFILGLAVSLHAANVADSCNCYALTGWTVKDGLPGGNVLAITQDRGGYLWLGMNGGGLVRFDGSQFVAWSPGEGEAALRGSFIPALVGSRDGNLWVGFSDASGVSRIQDGHVTNYSTPDGLALRSVSAMLEDRTGTLWVGGSGGLWTFRRGVWDQFTFSQGAAESDVFSIYEDRSGELWLGTSAGVYRRAAGADAFVLVDQGSRAVQSVAQDDAGVVWVSDSRRMVRALTGDHAVVGPAPLQASGAHLLHDRRDNLWIAALGEGLFRARRISANSHRLVVERVSYENKFVGAARSLFEDREDNVWVGLRGGGLLRLSEGPIQTDIQLAGLTNDGVRALKADQDGNVWVATGHNLNQFSAHGRQTYDFSQTLALHIDRSGTMWAATPQGVGRVVNGRLSPLAIPRVVRFERTISFTASPDDGLWLCNNDQGVFHWRDNVLTRFDDVPSVARRPCDFVYTDSHRRVWVGFTSGGIAVYYDGEFHPYEARDGLARGSVQAIYEDSRGAIWVSTADELTRILGGRLTTISARNGLPNRIVPSIVEDADGYLWLGVHAGSAVARFKLEEADEVVKNASHQIAYLMFDESDGLRGPLLRLSRPTAVRAHDGRLWFVSGDGVVVIDPRRPAKHRQPALPRIERIFVDGNNLPPTEGLILPPRTQTLQIDYAALSLSAASKLRFQYMLEGFSRTWVEADGHRQVSYTNLRPGHYRLRVHVTGDGATNGPDAIWSFSVLPPFYLTYWFYGACLGVTGLALWTLWWLRLRAVRKEFALVIAERARVSRDIHDTLLQSLGAFSLQLEILARQLEPSQSVAREQMRAVRAQVGQCIGEARRSIWELRSPGLEAHDLADGLQEMARDSALTSSANIQVVVHGKPRRSSPRTEEQLLKIAQEATINAIRHGNADEITIGLDYDRRSVQLCISDNGRGFKPEALAAMQTGHWGLKNMQERAATVNGRFHISSVPGRGTTVETTVPF